MKNLGYYNGRYALLENMSIPILDRSIVFGDAIYDSLYTRNYIPYCLDEHINRFFESIKVLDIRLPFTKNRLKDIISELIVKLDSGDLFIYWQASRGAQIRDHIYQEGLTANLLIMITPKSIIPKNKRMSLVSMPDLRYCYCNIKATNLIPNVMASTFADRNNFDEVVFLRDSYVTECSHSNINIIKNQVFITPIADNTILPGIARKHLMQKCIEFGIKVEERRFTLQELMEADEIINSSAGSLCTRVVNIDNKPVGCKDDALFFKLQDAIFDDYLKGTAKNE